MSVRYFVKIMKALKIANMYCIIGVVSVVIIYNGKTRL